MSVRYTRKWEAIDNSTRRLRIYGGWLVNSETFYQGSVELLSESLVFVPDMTHEWGLEEEEAERSYVENANARLITAAPDLINVCEILIQATEENGEWYECYDPLILIEMAKKAIAKAEGK